MVTMTIATVLLVLVFGFVIYSLVHHRKSEATRPISISTRAGSANGPG